MIEEILTASGIPFRQGRYLNPPLTTYAVYFDDQEVDGADPESGVAPMVVSHDVSVELYEPERDPEAEAAIETQLAARGIHWTKAARYWLQSVQRYQTVYDFEFYEKRRATSWLKETKIRLRWGQAKSICKHSASPCRR